MLEKIANAHPTLVPFFFTGTGHEAQFTESQIMVDLLLRLKERNLMGLPVHDAVIIPRPTVDEVRSLMASTFFDHTSIDGLINEGEAEE